MRGLVIPVTAFWGDGLQQTAVRLCGCVTLSLRKCTHPENCTLLRTPPPPPSAPRRTWIETPLPPASHKHTHTNTRHPPPREQQELALGDYGEGGKKAFRRTVICFSPAVDHGQAKKKEKKKTPLFLPLSPFLAAPAKKLGRAAL